MIQATTESSTPARLGLEALRGAEPLRRIAGRNRTKADVLFYREAGRDFTVKDYGARPFWIRHTIARLLVRREARAYAAAAGLPGVPRFYGQLGPFALVLEGLEGATLAELGGRRLDPAVFDGLAAVLEGLHARGIALGDLHHRDVIVGSGGSVHVVDLATAWVLGPRPGPFGRLAFRWLAQQDRVALARLRARYTGGDEVQAVTAVGRGAARRHRGARRLKAVWDRLRGRRPEARGRTLR